MNSTIANPIALLGRILISLLFLASGVSKMTGFAGTVGYIMSKGLSFPEALAGLAAALELIAGLAIVLGYKTRLAAFALAIYTLATGFIFHDFWASPADQVVVQQVMFLKNLSIAGGLLLLSAGGIGSWAIDDKSRVR